MAFYKKPIQPYDPIQKEGQDGGAIRYFRNDFDHTGQNSHDTPPSQDPGQWMALTNTMPISRGNIDRRWGYFSLANLGLNTGVFIPQARHLYSYQRDTDGLRKLIVTTTQLNPLGYNSFAIGEDGSTYASITQSGATPSTPRVIASRSAAYFYSGVATSNQKWDGSVDMTGLATNVTKWGINVNEVANSVSGPNLGGTALDLGDNGNLWANPNNIKTDDGVYAVSTSSAAGVSSNTLKVTNFGLTASGQVAGIQTDIKGHIAVIGNNFQISRPTAFAPYNGGPYFAPSNAIDGDPNTTSDAVVNDVQISLAGEQWFGFPAYSGPPAVSITLKVSSRVQISNGTTGQGIAAYSLNGGITWTPIYTANGNRNLTTDPVVLSPGQDLTQVRVSQTIEFDSSTAPHGFCIGYMVDSWIEVVNNTPPPSSSVVSVQLVKQGVAYGAVKTFTVSSGADAVFTLGGATDLWAGSYLSTDLTDPTFGLEITAVGQGFTVLTNLDYAKITIYLTGAGIVIGTPVAGNITLTIGRIYYEAFRNPDTGHISDLSAPSASTGPLTNQEVPLTLSINNDPQVGTKLILATADGGDPSILYLVAEVPNSQPTFTDNNPETSLLLNQQYLFTDDFGNDFGVANNTPPPLGTLACKHKGRLWMAVGQLLYFTKSISELTLPNGFVAGRYEESWPATNYFDISPGAETVTGLLSDGDVLYIATSRHIRRLFGDDPSNFQEPEIVHQEAGVLNQDVWTPIFMQGTPSGTMWLTPDNRVIMSDFNTYRDVGEPIQDVLNTINPLAATNSHAAFFSQGPYDIFVLAIPTGTNLFCDTLCVYDLRTQQWMIWKPADQSSAMLFNVTNAGKTQWLFTTVAKSPSDSAYVYQYSSQYTQDRGVDFTSTAQTTWLDLGSPTYRKLLNEIEVVANSAILVTIEGADTQNDFNSPEVIVLARSLTRDPANRLKVFLAGQRTRKRYYRFTFTSDGPSQDFLDSYSIYVIPLSTI